MDQFTIMHAGCLWYENCVVCPGTASRGRHWWPLVPHQAYSVANQPPPHLSQFPACLGLATPHPLAPLPSWRSASCHRYQCRHSVQAGTKVKLHTLFTSKFTWVLGVFILHYLNILEGNINDIFSSAEIYNFKISFCPLFIDFTLRKSTNNSSNIFSELRSHSYKRWHWLLDGYSGKMNHCQYVQLKLYVFDSDPRPGGEDTGHEDENQSVQALQLQPAGLWQRGIL